MMDGRLSSIMVHKRLYLLYYHENRLLVISPDSYDGRKPADELIYIRVYKQYFTSGKPSTSYNIILSVYKSVVAHYRTFKEQNTS